MPEEPENIIPFRPRRPTPEELKQQVLAHIRANLQQGDQFSEMPPEIAKALTPPKE